VDALLAGIFPAWQAMRSEIVGALRHVWLLPLMYFGGPASIVGPLSVFPLALGNLGEARGKTNE